MPRQSVRPLRPQPSSPRQGFAYSGFYVNADLLFFFRKIIKKQDFLVKKMKKT